MKLNNKGWGIKEMTIIMLILLFFLAIACFNVYKLYMQFDVDARSKYLSLQNRIETAATKYVMNFDIDTTKETVVTSSELEKSNYLTEFEDENGNSCKGYVIFKGNDYNTYISCPQYTTENYSEIYVQ